jgi:hypothetical protein
LKIAFPFTTISFKKYFLTILSAYIFLYTIYSLVYFGVLTFLTDNVPQYIGVILIVLFTIIIYFGKQISTKLIGGNLNEH